MTKTQRNGCTIDTKYLNFDTKTYSSRYGFRGSGFYAIALRSTFSSVFFDVLETTTLLSLNEFIDLRERKTREADTARFSLRYAFA